MSRAPVAFVVGLLLGAAGAAFVMLARAEPDQPVAADAGLGQRLDAIDAELRALRTAVAEQRPAPAPRADMAPAPLADPRLDEVLAALAPLQASVADMAQRLDALGQAWVDTAKLQSRSEPVPETLPDSPPDLAAFDALRNQSMDDLTKQHLLWTYEQVGAKFGRPEKVGPSPNGVGIKYFYELPSGEEFCFWFVDGKVIGAFWV